MKRTLVIILISLSTAAHSWGKNDYPSRKAFLVFEIKTILETDGITTRMTENGDLHFYHKGNAYLFELKEDNQRLFYGRLSRFHKYHDKVTKEQINLINSEINYKIIKVLGLETGYSLRAEFLLKDAQCFKLIYNRLFELMENSYATIENNIPLLTTDTDSESFTIKSFKIMTEINDTLPLIYPVVTFSAPAGAPQKYPILLRLYRNNTLIQDKASPADYSCTDTLHSTNQSQPHWMKHWPYIPDDTTSSYRCELWHDGKCLTTISF